MQAVATTMGSPTFTEPSAAHRAMLNAAMLARSAFAHDTLREAMRIFAIDTRYKPLECLAAVYQNLRRVLSVGDAFPSHYLGIMTALERRYILNRLDFGHFRP
jgi:hypothetical protein